MLLKKLDKKLKRSLIIALSSLLLVACSTNKPKTVTVIPDSKEDVMVCKVPLGELAYPSQIYWKPVTFYVINKEIMKSIVDGTTTDYPYNIFAVDADGYANLSDNMQQIISHMGESKTRIFKVEEYFKKDQKSVDVGK